MIDGETKRKLHEMGFGAMSDAVEMQQKDISSMSLPFEERFQRVVDYAYQEKHNEKAGRLIKQAGFNLPNAEKRSLKTEGRGLDTAAIGELFTYKFASSNTNVVFQGFTGSGKTFLACALGKEACKRGVRTKYVRLPDLLVEYDEASLVPRQKGKTLRKYGGYGLLIIDEWLLEDLSHDERRFIFELVERRHNSAPTVFCTQYKREDWHKRLGGKLHADAIMDRIIHNAVWIDAGTVNMRERCAKMLE